MKAEREITHRGSPALQALPAGREPELSSMWLRQMIARAETATRGQREMMRKSRRFYSGQQWDEQTRRQRRVGKRLTLTFNRLARYVNQLTGEFSELRLLPDVTPRDLPGEDLSAQDADMIEMPVGEDNIPRHHMLEGWLRHRLQGKAFKDESRVAAKQQLALGMAYYQLFTEYASDDTMHQDFGVEVLENPVNVLMDPSHRRVDGMDAAWVLVSNWQHKTKVQQDHPDLDTDMLRTDEFVGARDLDGFDSDLWMDEKDRIRVSDFWQMIETQIPVVLMSNGDRVPVETYEKPSVKAAYANAEIGELGRRDLPVKTVWHWELVGPKITRGPERTYWKTLPVIKVPGRQAWDGSMRVYQSLIHSMEDAQQASNVGMSSAVERIQISSLSAFAASKQQLAGYEKDWEESNVRRKQVLYYNTMAEDGVTMNKPPERIEGAQIDSATLNALQLLRAEEAGLAGLDEAGFGFENNSTSERSQALRMRGQRLSTAEFWQNHARAAELICLNMLHAAPHYMDGTRTQMILDRSGRLRKVRLNASVRRDPVTGEEFVVNSMQHRRDMNVNIRMVPGDMTRRQESWAALNELAKGTDVASRLVDVGAEALDMPDAAKIKRRVRSMLEVEDMDEEEREAWVEGQIAAEQSRETAIARIAEWREEKGLGPKQPPPQVIEAQAKAQTAQSKAQQAGAKTEELSMLGELKAMKAQFDVVMGELQAEKARAEVTKTELEAAKAAREMDEGMEDRIKDFTRKTILEMLQEPAAREEGS